MTVKEDLELVERVVRGAAQGSVKHHEVSLALQALERIGKPRVTAVEITPPLDGFECGRCWQLHAPIDQRGEAIPEHSARCPMREERARAWDAGYVEGLRDNEPGSAPMATNPHR